VRRNWLIFSAQQHTVWTWKYCLVGINQHIASLACVLLSNVFLFLYSNKSEAREDCHTRSKFIQ